MKFSFKQTADVVMVVAIAATVYKVIYLVMRLLWTAAYQTDSCMLTAILSRTAWLAPVIAFLAALCAGVIAITNLRSKRSRYIVIVGIISVLLFPVSFVIINTATPVTDDVTLARPQSAYGQLAMQLPSDPIQLQCYTSVDGQEREALVFDSSDILDAKLGVSPFSGSYLVELKLITSASDKLRKSTASSVHSRYLIFTTNQFFLANGRIEEPIENGCISIPLQSESEAKAIIGGIQEHLYQ